MVVECGSVGILLTFGKRKFKFGLLPLNSNYDWQRGIVTIFR